MPDEVDLTHLMNDPCLDTEYPDMEQTFPWSMDALRAAITKAQLVEFRPEGRVMSPDEYEFRLKRGDFDGL